MYELNVLELLHKINLARKIDCMNETRYEVDDILKCSTWNYPKEPGFKSVPSNGLLFSVFRSMVNLQLTTFKFLTSYLVKYVTKMEQKKSVHFTKDQFGDYRIDIDNDSQNPKKCKGAKGEEKSNSSTREISLIEMIWKLLELPFVFTNVEFVHYSSQAPEHRYFVKKNYRSSNCNSTLQVI